MLPRIAVLMSTYNGEAFVAEQIQSILKQKDVNVTLFIRDDGSTDATESIVRQVQQTNDAIVFRKGSRNLNVGNSFMQLIYTVPDEYDYYALSDQDDIWLPEKLVSAVNKIEESKAVLYASNQENVDKQGNSLGMRYTNVKIHLTAESIVCRNMLAGCTMVFPAEFKRLLCEKNRRPTSALLRQRIHDVWLAGVASVVGEIYYDPRSFIYYRQHDNNVVGSKKATVLDDLCQKVRKLKDASQRRGRSRFAKELIERYSEYIEAGSVVRKMAQPKENRRYLIKRAKQISSYTGERKTVLKLKILFGLF